MELIQLKNNVVLIVIAAILAGVDGNSHGAPLSSCENMGAVHVVFPSHPPETSPFAITFDQV